MKHVSTTTATPFLKYARRGALLLALGAAGPVAWGQSFGPVIDYSTGASYSPNGMALGDVNGDGLADIVTSHYNVSMIGVLLGRAGGSFAPASFYSTGPNSGPSKVGLGDMNSDGRLDIVTANSEDNTIGVLLGQAGGSFAPVVAYSLGINTSSIGAWGITLGDVNADSRPDIITTIHSSASIAVLLGQAGGFAVPTMYPTTANNVPGNVVLGDVNGDGRADIVVTSTNLHNVGILLGQAGGTFGVMTSYPIGAGTFPIDVALGDVNGDGQPDIVTANGFTNNVGDVGVLIGQANGSFAAATSYPCGGNLPQTVALGDVNRDGRLDIVTTNYNTDNVGVLLGQIGGGFASGGSYALSAANGSGGTLLYDINSDGWLDIITHSYSRVGFLLNTGTFTPLATARPAAAEVDLYPNPARGSFTVQLPAGLAPGPAELLNSLGQVVRRSAAAAPRFTVETAGLAPGIYTLRLDLGAGTVARRVVVE